jgi:lipopolysaccharide/colanic/teichoic acid biosynthesis glycosyltransferase
MLSITNFSHKIRSQSTKHPANKMLRGAVSGKTVLGRPSGSSVAACSDAMPLKDSAGPRTVQNVELQSERAATVSTDGQEPGVVPLLEANANRSYFLCKRCLDVCLAGVILFLLVPVLLFIAVLIKLDSRGPVFFTHERVGAKRKNTGRETVWAVTKFGMHKFRSMSANADSRVHEAYIRDFVAGRVQPSEESGGKFKLTNDPRVTRVGRMLRRTSLDELPQLFNVLKGQMSLVGPRPVPAYEVACYRNGEHKRLAALPWITCLWQVNGRCRVSFEEMIRMDLEYIRNASLWLDLRILLLTIPAVLWGRGAE